MASIIKADNIQKVSDGTNIIKKCGSTITLGSCGATIALACGASQTGFGRTGTVDWCTTAKTAPFTGVSGKGYFVNTSCGAVTVTLPATPTAGDIISVADYASTFQTNNVTLCNNGSKINGGCSNAVLSTQGQSITLVYVDSTRGWKNTMDSTSDVTAVTFMSATGGTVVTCGDYKTHIFTGAGTFCVSSLSNLPANNNVDYLVVAGGGAGGGAEQGGGGGAGGFRVSNSYGLPAPSMFPLASCTGVPVTTTSYPITVGGGAPSTVATTAGVDGASGSSSIFSTITSTGGGGGGGGDNPAGSPTAGTGQPGGSGGGGGSAGGGNPGTPSGGTGNTPPVSPPQGNNGGTGLLSTASNPGVSGGGGGGGAVGANGAYPNTPDNGFGGVGGYISDTFIGATAPSYGTPGPVGSTRYFAGGGGAGTYSYNATSVVGGSGGGGTGGRGWPCGPAINATAGTTNTGGGGGGGGNYGPSPYANGGGGGSGIVMIRYRFQ